MKTRHHFDPSLTRKSPSILFALALIFITLGLMPGRPASAASAERVALTGHLAARAIGGLTLVGALSPAKPLSLDLVLPLRNQAALEDLLRRQADPTDALYGKYLTPSQFTDRFGPAVSDVNAVVTYAKSQGLTIKEIAANRTTISVTGPVSAVQAAFGLKMRSYTGKHGEAFYAPDAEPTVPAALSGKLLAVVGLNHVGNGRAFSHRVTPRPSSPRALPDYARPVTQANYSGHDGLSPLDILSVYNFEGNSNTGSGLAIALYELSTYTASDIAAYESYYGTSSPTLDNVGVNGFNTNSAPNGAAGEVTLDIDMVLALSHTISKIIVYEAGDNGTNSEFETATLDIFTKFATDDLAGVLSVSYGISEFDITQAEASANNQELMQVEAQGQTVCVASGDAGAYTDQSGYPDEDPNTSEPASQPLVTAVGGTDLADSSSYPFSYVAETSWADPNDTGRGDFGTGGGGGVSGYWPIPSYQNGAFSTSVNPQGSTTNRNVPDVALYGDYDDGGYDVYFQGAWGGENGTSAACPLWAAFLTDVNQGRFAAGKSSIALANTAIYSIAKSSKYSSDFHDINDDSNNLVYNAVNGYDNSTGWGSFNGDNLYNDLVSYGSAALAVKSLSFSPTSGHPGDVLTGTVTLTGNAPSGGAVVTIAENGTSLGTVTVASGTSSVQFTLTLGTATGTFTISATYNGSTKSTTITVTAAAPTITSISPTSGPIGTVVTITGTNLGGVTKVRFHNADAVTYSANSGGTQITVTVPSGAGTGTITVTTPGGSVTSSQTFTIAATPTISAISPTSGPVGTVVTITGTNFTGVSKVRFHNADAVTYTVNSSTQISVTVPSGAGTGTITVTTSAGAVTSSQTFTVTTGPPTVTSFTPTSGAVGTSVTITGTNFTGATAVKFNSTAATTYTVTSATQITATVPTGATTGKISVTTSGGTATSSGTFTVTSSAPTITSISPTSGPIGTVVTITGTHLNGVTKVRFHNAYATTFSANGAGTQITCTVPTGAGTGTITVTTPAGAVTSSQTFTITVPPTISAISPTSGPVGTVVTITGTNFTGVSRIRFHNANAVTYTVNSSTQISVTVPSGAGTGTITVNATGGSVTSSQTFTVTTGSAPTITSFSPTSGKVGITVTITGTGFSTTTGVKFNGVTASGSIVSDTQLTATVPSGATTGKITVTTSTGTATSSGNFTVISASPPTITSFTPTSGPVGTSVKITGTNFTGATSVKFNGTAATSFTVNSATQVTATVPSGATTGKITVTTSAGTATSSSNYTVTF